MNEDQDGRWEQGKVGKVKCEGCQTRKMPGDVDIPTFHRGDDDRSDDDVEKIQRPDPQDAPDVEILDIYFPGLSMFGHK